MTELSRGLLVAVFKMMVLSGGPFVAVLKMTELRRDFRKPTALKMTQV